MLFMLLMLVNNYIIYAINAFYAIAIYAIHAFYVFYATSDIYRQCLRKKSYVLIIKLFKMSKKRFESAKKSF